MTVRFQETLEMKALPLAPPPEIKRVLVPISSIEGIWKDLRELASHYDSTEAHFIFWRVGKIIEKAFPRVKE